MSEEKMSLQEWAHESLKTHTPEAVRQRMRDSGFSEAIVEMAMAPMHVPPVMIDNGPVLNLDNLRSNNSTVLDVMPTFAEIVAPGKANEIHLEDKLCIMALEMTLPRVVVVDNFMSDEECNELIEASRAAIQRSSVIERGTGGSTLDDVRTSSGMFHPRGAAGIVATVERRISELIQWPVENGEGMQILRYGVDEKYEPHNDYFDEKDPGSVVNIGQSGQRIASVLIYLNNPEAGGSTNFPDVGLEVKPRKGSLLFFAYPTHDKRSKTTHGGMPVLSGEKWVAVKWYRINKF